jgi:hypothetical protein
MATYDVAVNICQALPADVLQLVGAERKGGRLHGGAHGRGCLGAQQHERRKVRQTLLATS